MDYIDNTGRRNSVRRLDDNERVVGVYSVLNDDVEEAKTVLLEGFYSRVQIYVRQCKCGNSVIMLDNAEVRIIAVQ